MKRLAVVLTQSLVITACGASTDAGAAAHNGLVMGVVRDSLGRRVANAKVCAAAVFMVNGTPLLLSRIGTTSRTGAYEIPIDFSVDTAVRAGLSVAATPPLPSGLAPGLRSGLSVLIAATPPPAETTHADVVVPRGEPYAGVFCAYGP